LLDHLENTKGFGLQGLKHLVMDKVDKLLDLDFGLSIDKILKVIQEERKIYIFSVTMTYDYAQDSKIYIQCRPHS